MALEIGAATPAGIPASRAQARQADSPDEPRSERPARRRRLGVAVVAASLLVVVAMAGAVFLLTRDDDGPAGRSGAPRAVSTAELREFASNRQAPVYWIGEARGFTYELTETQGRRVYVRYLPEGSQVGDRRPLHTTVGTYPVPEAYAIALKNARRGGSTRRAAPGGGIAVFSRARPTSVYLAYPGLKYLIEVYDRDPRRARKLALSGRLQRVS